MVDRRRGVGAQADHGGRAIHAAAICIGTGEGRRAGIWRQRVQASRISVKRLEHRPAVRTYVARTEDDVGPDFTLGFEAKALIVRRTEILAYDGAREFVWIDARVGNVRQSCKRVRNGRSASTT